MDLPVSKHCADVGHCKWDLKCMNVDFVPPLRMGGNRLTRLKRKELEWIYKFDSLKPHGLNVEFKVNSKIIR